MNLASAAILSLCMSQVSSFLFNAPAFARSLSAQSLRMGGDDNVIFGGNDWKPDSGGMKSTDVGDYFPEGYEDTIDFKEGMMGSQTGGNKNKGPELPGMEQIMSNDAIMMGGIDVASEIPAGMKFIPSSVPDGTVQFQVASSSKGGQQKLVVKPICMGFEDFYANFSEGSHPSLNVSPKAGRMDRRGGEPSEFVVSCEPKGQAGTFDGDLVIFLPEDNSKICYKVSVTSF